MVRNLFFLFFLTLSGPIFGAFVAKEGVEVAERAVTKATEELMARGIGKEAAEAAAREIVAEMGVKELGSFAADVEGNISKILEKMPNNDVIESALKTEGGLAKAFESDAFANARAALGDFKGGLKNEFQAALKDPNIKFTPEEVGYAQAKLNIPEADFAAIKSGDRVISAEQKMFERRLVNKEKFSPAEKNFFKAEGDLKTAEIRFNAAEDGTLLKEQLGKDLEKAQADYNTAVKAKAGTISNDLNAQELEMIQAEKEFQAATTPEASARAQDRFDAAARGEIKLRQAQEELEIVQLKNEFEIAKNQLRASNEKLGKLKKGTPEYEQELKNNDVLKQNKNKIGNELQKKINFDESPGTYLKLVKERLDIPEYGKGISFKRNLGDLGKKAVGKLKSGAGFIYESALSGIVMGVFFTVPNWIFASIESASQRKAMLKNIQSPQSFANMWLKIPQQFIDTQNPANSLFLYMRVEESLKDSDIRDEDLLNGQFFVSLPQYGKPGDMPITDPQFPDVMLHLNTGAILLKNGDLQGVAPLLKIYDSQTQLSDAPRCSVADVLNQLAGDVANGTQRSQGQSFSSIDSLGGFFSTAKPVSSTYVGNLVLSAVFSDIGTPKNRLPSFFPPLLRFAVQSLTQGCTLGTGKNIFSLRQVPALSPEEIKFLSDNIENVSGSFTMDQLYPFAAMGVRIYLADNLPLTQRTRNSLARLALDSNISLPPNLIDKIGAYVVPLDNQGKAVDLMVPAAGAFGSAPSYQANPNIQFLYSIFEDKIYTLDGSDNCPVGAYGCGKGDPTSQEAIAYFGSLVVYPPDVTRQGSTSPELAPISALMKQVQFIGSFILQQNQIGPFPVANGKKLELDKSFLQNQRPIYRIAAGLENGADDYVIALDKTVSVPTMYPDGVVYLISLITSRFYDDQLMPSGMVVGWNVYQEKDSTVRKFKLGALPVGAKQLCAGKAKFFNVFTDIEINTNEPAVGTYENGYTEDKFKIDRLPITPHWAMNALSVADPSDTTKKIGMSDYLKNLQIKNSSGALVPLIDEINKTYTNWLSWIRLNKKNTLNAQALKGPFTYPTKISISANDQAIESVPTVYQSNRFPGEYLVLSNDMQGKDIVSQFPTDGSYPRYLISLSTGAVYDAVPPIGSDNKLQYAPGLAIDPVTGLPKMGKDSSGKDTGVYGDSDARLETTNFLTKLGSINKDLLEKIKKTQIAARAKLFANLTGERLRIASINKDGTTTYRQLVLDKTSYFNNQFIYIDVAELGNNALNGDGTIAPGVLEKANYFYIAGTMIDDPNQAGKKIPSFETLQNLAEVGAAPLLCLSNMMTYDSSGASLGGYWFNLIKENTVLDPSKTGQLLSDFLQSLKNNAPDGKLYPLGIEEIIRNKSNVLINALIKQQDAALKERDSEQIPSLSPDTIKELTALDVNGKDILEYEPQLPISYPLFIKRSKDKYYKVVRLPNSTSDLYAPPVESASVQSGPTLITDYNVFIPGVDGVSINDTRRVVVFDASTGAPIKQIEGYNALVVRAADGIQVASNGSEKRTIPLSVSSLTLKSADGKTEYLTQIATGQNGTPIFYHSLYDKYLAQVKNSTKGTVSFVDLTTGQMYNIDGSAKKLEFPLYVNSADQNDYFYQFLAPRDTIRVIAKSNTGSYGLFAQTMGRQASYTAPNGTTYSGNYYALGNANASLDVVQLIKDASGSLLPISSWKWFKWYQADGQIFPGDGLQYQQTDNYGVPLVYIQRRAVSESPLQPPARPASQQDLEYTDTPVYPAVLFYNVKDVPTMIFYANQMCPLVADGLNKFKSSYSIRTGTGTYDTDGNEIMGTQIMPFSISLQEQVLVVDSEALIPLIKDERSLKQSWISITDGNAVFDYVYHYAAYANVTQDPELAANKDYVLNSLPNFRDALGYAVTTAVPFVSQLLNGNSAHGGRSLLVPYIGMNNLMPVALSDVKNKDSFPLFADMINNQLNQLKANRLKVNSYGSSNQYLYVFTSVDVGQPYYIDGYNGLMVDLSNGVLYETIFGKPVGFSLPDWQLLLLQSAIGFNVTYKIDRVDVKANPPAVILKKDEAGNPLVDGLQFIIQQDLTKPIISDQMVQGWRDQAKKLQTTKKTVKKQAPTAQPIKNVSKKRSLSVKPAVKNSSQPEAAPVLLGMKKNNSNKKQMHVQNSGSDVHASI